MKSLETRLKALETLDGQPRHRPLPIIVADDTPDSELQRLRTGGREVHRMSDAVELFVCTA